MDGYWNQISSNFIEERIVYSEGQKILSAKDFTSKVLYVDHGTVMISNPSQFTLHATDRPIPVRSNGFKSNFFFSKVILGELETLSDHPQALISNVFAVTPCIVYAVSAESFKEEVDSNPDLKLAVIQLLQPKLSEFIRISQCEGALKMEGICAYWLWRYLEATDQGGKRVELPRESIRKIIETGSNFTKLLSDLKKSKAIDFDHSYIQTSKHLLEEYLGKCR